MTTKTATKDHLAQGGYTVPPGGKKPKLPTTGSGVKASVPSMQLAAPPQPDSEAMRILRTIAAGASDPKVDPEKSRALWELHKEIAGEERRLAYLSAFRELKARLPAINPRGRIEIPGKSGKKGQDTPFMKWIDIQQETGGLLYEYGFTIQHRIEPAPDPSRIHVITELSHVRGHVVRSIFPVPAETSGSKNNVQGWGSANSYGKRYNTVNLLDLKSRAPEDRDLDGHDAERVAEAERCASAEQIEAIRKAIEFSGIAEHRVLDKFGVALLEDMPAAKVEACLDAISDYQRRKAEGEDGTR